MSDEPHTHDIDADHGERIDSIEAAGIIGVQRVWLLALADRDDDDPRRLRGYIKVPGSGWREHHRGDNVTKKPVWFYRKDVEEYKKKWPINVRDYSKVAVTDEERSRIVAHATPELKERGFVTRTRLRDELMNEYNYSHRIYDKIKVIASELKWPLPERGGSDGRSRKKRK